MIGVVTALVLVQAQASPQPGYTNNVVRAERIAGGFVNPWALEFLPDGRLLVTERPGRLRVVSLEGNISEPILGVPAVAARGQGGLLDVAVDPRFAQNQTIYLSYAEPGPEGNVQGTAVARARLVENRLEDVRVLYSQRPKLPTQQHFGSRIVFARDGTMFITQGDRGTRDSVQPLTAGQGKIIRINTDGTIPRDNPFVARAGAQHEIWSYGHRNAQAAALHPETGELWTVEHGAMGGDELNNPRRGLNYGWPVITYGINYNGQRIGAGTSRAGMEQPVYYWDPVIAPSGMVFYTGDRYPGWRGSVLIGGLASQSLVRLEMANGRVTREERYLGELGQRVRDVIQGPDGYLYIVTDSPSNGQVMRIVPASR